MIDKDLNITKETIIAAFQSATKCSYEVAEKKVTESIREVIEIETSCNNCARMGAMSCKRHNDIEKSFHDNEIYAYEGLRSLIAKNCKRYSHGRNYTKEELQKIIMMGER
jgi:hypothetical protein